MDIRNLKMISLVFVFLLASITSIFALGVSSPYWDKNPLKMYPGEIRDVEFTLVNKPDADPADAFVKLTNTGGIAELISGSTYTVQPGTTNTKVVLKISIPSDAQIGEIYNVAFSVESGPPEEEGTIQLAVGYNVGFPVEVVPESEVIKPEVPQPPEPEKEKPGIMNYIWIVIGIAIIIILYLLFKRKR